MMRNERLIRVLTRVAQQSKRSIDDVVNEQLQFVSMRTMVDMDEVANAIVFLASPEARHISGQVIAVDGDIIWEA
jgi:NAD(P)-dependent dehydrogenase (short-subunit alcohol dehydrogenase family)